MGQFAPSEILTAIFHHQGNLPEASGIAPFQLDHARLAPQLRGLVMPLKTLGVIEIPNAAGSEFDHGAFDPRTRRVFIAHTARDCLEVIDDTARHIATLSGFPGVAGAVADTERFSSPTGGRQASPGSTP
jgi:hypothetical protein